jgi:hypothetical protein
LVTASLALRSAVAVALIAAALTLALRASVAIALVAASLALRSAVASAALTLALRATALALPALMLRPRLASALAVRRALLASGRLLLWLRRRCCRRPPLLLLLNLRYAHIASISCRALRRGIRLHIAEKLLHRLDGIIFHHAHMVVDRYVLPFQNRNNLFAAHI